MIGTFAAQLDETRRSAQRQYARDALEDLGIAVAGDAVPQDVVDRLNALRAECGCRTGEVATLVGIGAVMIAWATGVWLASPAAFVVGLACSAAIVVGAGIGGKVVGIAVARTRRRLLLRQVERELTRTATDRGGR